MSDKIFFSYSRFDSAFVLKLASDLRSAGATVWLDQLDIPPGKHWDSEIEGALHNANCLLAILSPKSLESDNVMDEISYALEEKKKVIPILLTDTGTPFRLRRLQRVDFTGDYEAGFKQLLKSINIEATAAPATPEPLPVTQPGSESSTIAALVREKEDYMWERCSYLNTIPAYQDYLRKTTMRQHVDEAWSKITTLEQETGVQTRHSFAGKSTAVKDSKKYILVAVSVIGLLGLTWGAYKIFSPRTEPPIVIPDQASPAPSIKTGSQTADTNSSKEKTAELPTNPSVPVPISEKENTRKKEAGSPSIIPSKKTPDKNKEQDNNNRNRTSVDTTANQNNTQAPPPIVITEPKSPPPASAPTQVTINSKVIVYLKLDDALDMDQKKKSPQRVRFSVTSPVQYQGHTLIKQGAIAHGTITLGSRITEITITEVEGANGKMLPVKSGDGHGKVKDIKENKPFIAIIIQGTYTF